MSLLVFGSSGQLGSALQTAWGANGSLAKNGIFLSRDQADFLNPSHIQKALDTFYPHLIINCAAYTAVDHAETHPQVAYQINAQAVKQIGIWAFKHNAKVIHFSTDYVFSGEGEQPWTETSPCFPQNSYGQSKRAGELALEASGCAYLLFRISWVYSEKKGNFLDKMLTLGQKEEVLSIVADQFGYPTAAQDIAETLLRILPLILSPNFQAWGTYHLSPPPTIPAISWYEFALKIFEAARSLHMPLRVKTVNPLSAQAYPSLAKRPLNSRLKGLKFYNQFGFYLPDFEISLMACLRKRYDSLTSIHP